MAWLDRLERIGELPAEVWLIPPIVILALMTAIGWLRRALRLRAYRAIAARTGLTVAPKILNPSEIRGSFRGRELVMHIVSRQRQTFRKRWTRVIVTVKNPEAVGDAEFDRRFVIQSRDGKVMARMFARNRELRDLLLRSKIDSVELLSAKLHVHYARSERDPAHAELLFTAATSLADAIDALEPDYTPEIIRSS
jgi:hypothetical protein